MELLTNAVVMSAEEPSREFIMAIRNSGVNNEIMIVTTKSRPRIVADQKISWNQNYQRLLSQNSAEEVLRFFELGQGDLFFIDAASKEVESDFQSEARTYGAIVIERSKKGKLVYQLKDWHDYVQVAKLFFTRSIRFFTEYV